MLILIIILSIIIIELGFIAYGVWPAHRHAEGRKVKTGGWIKPKEAPVFDDDTVIPLTDKYEQDYVNENTEP